MKHESVVIVGGMFQIERTGGSIGVVNVSWIVFQDTGDDIVTDAGDVIFEDGQTTGVIALMIKGDSTPELKETILVKLIHVSIVSYVIYYMLSELTDES